MPPTRAPSRGHHDAGVATTELALLFGLIIVLTMFPFQVALLWHAKQSADLAAETALDMAQPLDADTGQAEEVGRAIAVQSNQLTNIEVDVVKGRGGSSLVDVTVRGDVRYRIIPLPWSVTSVAQGRIEEFVGEDER